MKIERVIPEKVKILDPRKRTFRRSLTIPEPCNRHSLCWTHRGTSTAPIVTWLSPTHCGEKTCTWRTLLKDQMGQGFGGINLSKSFLANERHLSIKQ